MAASWTSGLPLHLVKSGELTAVSIPQPHVRRRVSGEAGLAMRILARAIEHLTDESVFEEDLAMSRKAEIKAVKLLMALNSQIYAECPLDLPWRGRIAALFHRIGPKF